ncbi:MAG TPA: Hsp70 family protein, partial [Chthoniobacterales bacterium]
MTDIVGIDLGTTNSLIGIMEAGFPLLLADADGQRLTPSVVYFGENSEPLVGRAATRMRVLRPNETISSIKRHMGTARKFCGTSPEEISALILRKLKLDAEAALAREVARAVITVPAYFNDAQRNATKRAGEIAGFTVERIVNEPTAAALAYGLDKLKTRAKTAVYDLGGGTFDISILELNNGVFEVLSTNGNTQLGGDDIDAKLLEKYLPDESSAEQRATLRDALITAKHRLSSEGEVEIDLPFFSGSGSLSLRLTRAEVETLARPVVEQTRGHCLRALADAKLKPTDLDEVILVGGVTRMPLVRQTVAEIF